MKNKRGFTLAELLVAMTLLVLIVFCFTPLMLASLNSVVLAGTQEQTIYEEKSSIEGKFAQGPDYTQPATDEVRITFVQNGKEVNSQVKGWVLQSEQQKMTGYIGQDVAQLEISPGSISESYNAGTRITIRCELIPFEDEGLFELVKGETKILKGSTGNKIPFEIDENDPHTAYLTLQNTGLLSMSNSPYTIKYGTGLSASLRVTQPTIIAVGASNAYYVRRGDGWVKGVGYDNSDGKIDKNNSNILRDALWTGSQYVVAGDSSWYCTNENGWSKKTLNSGSKVYDLNVSSVDSMIYSMGYYDGGFWGIYRYFQRLDTPESAAGYDLTIGDVLFGGPGYGTAVTSGKRNGNATHLYAWYTKSWSRVTGTYVSVNGLNTLMEMPDDTGGAAITCLEWNQKDSGGEFLAGLDNGRIYSLKDSSTTWVSDSDKAQALTANPNKPDKTYTRYKVVLTAEDGTTYEDYVIGTDLYAVAARDGKYYITIPAQGSNPAVEYCLAQENGKLYAEKILINYLHGLQSQITSSVNTSAKSGIQSLAFGADIWVAVGNNLSIKVTDNYKQHMVTTTYAYTVSDRNPQWKVTGESEVVESDPDYEDYVVNQTSAKILWRSSEDGAGWRAATSVPSGLNTLHKVAYVGNKFYAVGKAGTIISSTDGKKWVNEPKNGVLSADLYGIAGIGDE